MFDYDKWQEIIMTIRHNKLRTILTVFSLTWGMFMVILLSGLGDSFRAGVVKGFENWANNSGFMWGLVTTISEGGFQPGRPVRFDTFDTKSLLSQVKGIKYLAPRIGRQSQVKNIKNAKYFISSAEINGDYPDYVKIDSQILLYGRFINYRDLKENRKVAVLNKRAYQLLFETDVNPLGQYIQIQKVNFTVIGVTDPIQENDDNSRETNITIPFTTFGKIFNTQDRVGYYSFAAKEEYNVDSLIAKMMHILKRNNHVNPDDEEAIGSFNLGEKMDEVLGVFKGMKIFTYFIGIAVLIASVLGISNIMLIIVKERTKEIGIRKSMGASSSSIVSLIIQESIFLTLIGGLVGIIGAFLIIDALNSLVFSNMSKGMPFELIYVSNKLIFNVLIVLVGGGTLAGILPAQRAVRIKPIEAMRA